MTLLPAVPRLRPVSLQLAQVLNFHCLRVRTPRLGLGSTKRMIRSWLQANTVIAASEYLVLASDVITRESVNLFK